MAPEQAKGKVVDKRADVWAFGAVVYEMLTGTRAFVGDDVSDTLAAVLRAEVDMDRLPDEMLPRLRQVLRACLQRDPRQRVHDVADVRLAMEGAFETAGAVPAEPGVAPTLPLLQRPVGIAVTVLVAVIATGLAVWGLMRSDAPAVRPARFTIPVPPAARLSIANVSTDVAISRDVSPRDSWTVI